MWLRMALTVLIVFLYGCTTLQPFHQYIYKKPPETIRFATYNVYWQNGSKDKKNPNSICHLIKEVAPDIIVLQETYCFNEKHIEKQFAKSHPYSLFRHFYKNGNLPEDGLGILSRYPIVKNIYFPPNYGWFPGWLYVIKTPKGYIQVLNVHLNPKLVSHNNIGLFAEGLWLTNYNRLHEISYYYQYLDPSLPTIVAGDFNENDNGAATTFLRAHCFHDLLLHTPPYIKTWHYQFGPLQFSGRYDRIYTQRIKSIRVQVLQKGHSDHYPVVTDFRLPAN